MAKAIRILREVAVPLRDGTITRAEVWLPESEGTHPAILVRTPYLKETASPSQVDTRLAIGRGYAVVLQDARGCGTSTGLFAPFVDEETDGCDTVAWAAAQPWCDGRVVMAGSSYLGMSQWLAAAGRPPALRAIAPARSSDDAGEGWSYTGGVAEHGFLSTWSVTSLVPPERRWLDTPERAYDDAAGMAHIAPWTTEWYASPPGSPYWAKRSVAGRRDVVEVPAFVMGGWYDIFLAGTLASFARSRDSRDRLVLGPWGHDPQLSHLIGDANIGASGNGAELFTWALDFYDAVLAGRDPPGPRVRAYALGARRWLALETWPPAGITTLAIPLNPGSFTVSVNEPVPSRGGRGLLVGVPDSGWGIRDQTPLAVRPDVLSAGRHRLEGAVLMAGPVTARLATAAEGTGPRLWTVTLCLEQPGGELHNLCEGVANAPADAPSVEVSLGHVCVALPAGATLVTLVAGSSFPRWPRPASSGVQSLGEGSQLDLTMAPTELTDSAGLQPPDRRQLRENGDS